MTPAPAPRLNACELEIDLFCRGLRVPEDVTLDGARGVRRTRAGLGSGLELVIRDLRGDTPVEEKFRHDGGIAGLFVLAANELASTATSSGRAGARPERISVSPRSAGSRGRVMPRVGAPLGWIGLPWESVSSA
mgnify:CR=1 FL=1